MEFMIIAYEAGDEEAPARKLKVQKAHLRQANLMREKGHLMEESAFLNDAGQVTGTTLYCRFDSREELDQWIKNDPYWLGNIWVKIEVQSIP